MKNPLTDPSIPFVIALAVLICLGLFFNVLFVSPSNDYTFDVEKHQNRLIERKWENLKSEVKILKSKEYNNIHSKERK